MRRTTPEQQSVINRMSDLISQLEEKAQQEEKARQEELRRQAEIEARKRDALADSKRAEVEELWSSAEQLVNKRQYKQAMTLLVKLGKICEEVDIGLTHEGGRKFPQELYDICIAKLNTTRTLVDTGRDSMSKGLYKDAIASFKQALEISDESEAADLIKQCEAELQRQK
jgi:tetratricopeptide (TPR) repeat protein